MSIAPTRKTGAGSWNLDSPVRLSKGLEEGKALSKAAEKLTETIDAVVSVLDPASPISKVLDPERKVLLSSFTLPVIPRSPTGGRPE
jgi:hypothetical protein